MKKSVSPSETLAKRVLPASILCLLLLAGAAWAADMESGAWPLYRGPAAGGPEADLPDGPFGLALEWKVPLGSAYSNVSIAGGKAVTMFTSGEVDVVAAFDPGSGEELWRYELGEKYAGHDGSDDGPLGTPTLADGGVYALGPKGQLVALDLASGEPRWRVDLDESSSTVPFYGYTSSPVVSGELVIVATGGEGRALTAFDRRSGERRWARGDDSVTYQTPILAELGGREQLLAVTDQMLQGLDPKSGEILWQLRHSEGEQSEGSAHATLADGERFLVNYSRRSALYEVKDGGTEEVWTSRAFANSFALPVYHEGYFYGFTGNFLTCASAETGEIVWRSRPPGAFGLTLADARLAIMARDGDLVFVEASPEGYQEITRIAALDAGNYAIPSFAGGRVLVRNLSEMASFRIDASLAPRSAESAEDLGERYAGAFGSWARKVAAMPAGERQAAVEALFPKIEGPVAEDDGHVTFLHRGEVEDVGVSGLPGVQGDGLYPLEGTDLFFRTYQLDPAGQYTYQLSIDFENPAADPNNPLVVDLGFAQQSELRMPGFQASPHIEEPAADRPRGQVDGFPFRSEILDNTREIQVYRPAGYDQSGEVRYPLLIVNHGDNLLRSASFANTLDNILGESVEPLLAVFVPRAQGPEYGGPLAEGYNRFLREELLPHVEKHYRTDGRRGIMGPGSAGVSALYASFEMPDLFDRAAVQSYYLIEPASTRLLELVKEDSGPSKVVVGWSHNDYDFPNQVSAEEASRQLLEAMAEGDAEAVEMVGHHSPGWAGWRHQHAEVLAALFPAEEG